jgi:hypothetical protein
MTYCYAFFTYHITENSKTITLSSSPTFTKKASPIYSAKHGFLKSCVIVSMCVYFTSLKGKSTGIEFIESTSIKVCHYIRIPRHKTFDGIAKQSKCTLGWFCSCKLHLNVNYQGEIVVAKVMTGNVHDAQTSKSSHKV